MLKAARLLASSNELPAAAVADALGCTLEALYEVVHAIEAAEGGGDEAADRLSRSISAELRHQAGIGRRERPPKFSAAELRLLAGWSSRLAEWHPQHTADLSPLEEVLGALRGPLSVEAGLPEGLPPDELALRRAYLNEKKVPQLRWMLRRVQELLVAAAAATPAATSQPPQPPSRARRRRTTVVDLGCGKGDFALLLAAALPTSVDVVGIDTNRDAIAFAESRAAAAGLANATFRTPGTPPSCSAAAAAHAAHAAAAHAAAMPSRRRQRRRTRRRRQRRRRRGGGAGGRSRRRAARVRRAERRGPPRRGAARRLVPDLHVLLQQAPRALAGGRVGGRRARRGGQGRAVPHGRRRRAYGRDGGAARHQQPPPRRLPRGRAARPHARRRGDTHLPEAFSRQNVVLSATCVPCENE